MLKGAETPAPPCGRLRGFVNARNVSRNALVVGVHRIAFNTEVPHSADMNTHLLLSLPDDYGSDARGDFFERFVDELLRPMRYRVSKRLRVTGMEIDLLAMAEDRPSTILVECKAYRDPVPAEAISKLLGNVTLRSADAGWLFTTSDLTKDGRGQWHEIQQNTDLARRFTWYSPEKLIDVLVSQRTVVAPTACEHRLKGWSIGDWTLVVTQSRRAWLAQIVEEGIPTRFAVFDATSGLPLPSPVAQEVANASARFSSLSVMELAVDDRQPPLRQPRAQVARVVSGDSWDDPRPARPADFVGRDDVIQDVVGFIESVRDGHTQTRTLAIQGPSGWGKSSLTLKLAALAGKGKIPRCSLTAVDTRSAVNSAFVSEGLRQAFADAAAQRVIARNEYRIESLRDPLDSPSLEMGLAEARESNSCIVLIFDQFEELFAKEALFETFNAVRELSLDLDARQLPLVLGFAWKTDISLPQQHPAYHLWHQLADRRRTFRVREFGASDILRIIGRAEKAQNKRLAVPLRARLTEQCQGFPWLLKKLLVHVLQRVSEAESQYLLLERELDVELLFKEDLATLGEEAIRCLRYVASRAPVAVAEVEETFPRDTTNLLINAHLLVRSGMNYVVYWDIFRDYLVDGKVPEIPWARTFQRGPTMGLKALSKLEEIGPSSVTDLSQAMGIKEGTCFNLIADLVALQVVESMGEGIYEPASHLRDKRPVTLARHVQGQLRRHTVVRELGTRWETGRQFSIDDWYTLFAQAQPGASGFSMTTVHQYANNLKAWLLFAGLLDRQGRWIFRPPTTGSLAGLLRTKRHTLGLFLGSAAPTSLVKLLMLLASEESLRRTAAEKLGLRNAVADAAALGLVTVTNGVVTLTDRSANRDTVINQAKAAVMRQTTIQALTGAWAEGLRESEALGRRVEESIAASWQPQSARRYATGLRRYWDWAMGVARRRSRQNQGSVDNQ